MLRSMLLFFLWLTACSAAVPDRTNEATDCTGPCQTTPVELLRRMMFDNNPTGRTAFGVMSVQRYLRDQCYEDRLKPAFRDNSLVYDAGAATPDNVLRGRTNADQANSVFDYGIFRPGVSISMMVPKRTPVLVGSGDCGRETSPLSPSVPTRDAYLRKVFIVDNPAVFAQRVAALTPDGPNRVVRRSGPRCVHEMEMSPNNRINHLNSYILLARPSIEAMADEAVVVCLYRGTLASVGLPGALTAPQGELVEHVMERMPPVGFAPVVPYWKSDPIQALRYVRPGGETWDAVSRRINRERGK
jgi:hypothetical protein